MQGYVVNNHSGNFFAASEDLYQNGDYVLVELNSATTICCITSEYVEEAKISAKILRIANTSEIEIYKNEKKYLNDVKSDCIKAAKQLNLNMKVVSIEMDEKNNQLKVNFYADNRVDFREMAKKIGSKYRKRIEFRQIGARDKAKMIGGIGPCGLVLCCSLYLKTFESISINMAKNQLLALNPTKINGQCGRLLCCLGYEDEAYTELKKNLPKLGEFVKANDTKGKVVEVSILKSSYIIQTEKGDRIEIKK